MKKSNKTPRDTRASAAQFLINTGELTASKHGRQATSEERIDDISSGKASAKGSW